MASLICRRRSSELQTEADVLARALTHHHQHHLLLSQTDKMLPMQSSLHQKQQQTDTKK